ncbi:MAG: hypothetical protein EAX96_05890 [Candidatus Lokiarchaeota archaeon]|nr:hypothetical protein [Candidatus Lokiarchaeota archaeon]
MEESSSSNNISIIQQNRKNAMAFAGRTWKRREKLYYDTLHWLLPVTASIIFILLAYFFFDLRGLFASAIIFFVITILIQPTVRHKIRKAFLNMRVKQDEFKRFRPWQNAWMFLDKDESVAFFYDGKQTVRGIVMFRIVPSTRIKQNLFGFYRNCYRQGIPVFWAHYVVPKGESDVRENIYDNERFNLERMPIGQMDFQLDEVGGIWEMIMLVGTQVVRTVKTSLKATMNQISIKVKQNQSLLDGKLVGALPHAKIIPITSDELIETIHSLALGGSIPSFYISTAEATAVKLFHVPAFAISKSSKSHPPAEFTVPTHLPVDIPIGHGVEQETMNREAIVGLQVKDLFSNVMVIGGTSNERFQVISRILYKSCALQFCTILLTSSHKYRNLLDFIPNLRIIRLGTDSAIRIFDPHAASNGEYVTLLSEMLASLYKLTPFATEALEGLMFKYHSTGKNSLSEFYPFIDFEIDQLQQEKQLSYADKEAYRSIQRLFKNFESGKGVKIFRGYQIPMYKLLKQPVIIEIPVDSTIKKRFTLYVLLAKILTSIQELNYRGGLIFVEDARILEDFTYNKYGNNMLDEFLEKLIERFNQHGFGLMVDAPRPGNLSEKISGLFKTFIAFRLGPEQIKFTSRFLQLKTLSESKMTPLRYNSYHPDFLINADELQGLLKVPDHPESFSVQITKVSNLREVNTWTDEDVDVFLSDDDDVLDFHAHGEEPEQPTTMLKQAFSAKKELDLAFLILLKMSENQDLQVDSISIADQIYYDLLDTGEIQEHERADTSRTIKFVVLRLTRFKFLKSEEIPAGNHVVTKFIITKLGLDALEEHQACIRLEES